MKDFEISINGMNIITNKDETIFEAASKLNIEIPNFCNDFNLKAQGACRICAVEMVGKEMLVTSCDTKVEEGMEILTESKKLSSYRKTLLELIWANHEMRCMTCEALGECKLQIYSKKYDVEIERFKGIKKVRKLDESHKYFYIDQSKCIDCGKCIHICKDYRKIAAITKMGRGFEVSIGNPFGIGSPMSPCDSCGICIDVCPTGAIAIKKLKKYRYWEVSKSKATCILCEKECRVELVTKDNQILEVRSLQGDERDILCSLGRFEFIRKNIYKGDD